jgi:hypothetical protein
MVLGVNSKLFGNSVNQAFFVMGKLGVFFTVRSEFSNIIYELRLQRVKETEQASFRRLN